MLTNEVSQARVENSGGCSNRPKTTIPDINDFRENPEETISKWKDILSEALKCGSVQESTLVQYSKRLNKKELKGIIEYIIKSGNEIILGFPQDKIFLAEARDQLERYIFPTHNNYWQKGLPYSYKHLLVLLHSLTGRKGAVVDPVPFLKEKMEKQEKANQEFRELNPLTWLGERENKKALKSESFLKIIMGEGSNRIEFRIEDSKLPDTVPDFQAKIKRINEFLMKMRTLFPSIVVSIVEIGNNSMCAMDSLNGRVMLDISDPNYLEILAHEYGHSIYATVMENKKDNLLFYLFLLAQQIDNSEIVDDSNYEEPMTDLAGHPKDDINELFASSFASFLVHPNTFISFINDPDTPQGMKRFGMIIFCYFRDRIFKNTDFQGHFNDISIAKIEASLTDDYLLQFGLDHCNRDGCFELVTVKEYLMKKGVKNISFVELLIKAYKNNKEADVLCNIFNTISDLGISDTRYVDILLAGLQHPNQSVRYWAIKTISILELNDPRFVEPLIKLIQQKNESEDDTKSLAIKRLGLLGIKDKRILNVLLDLLSSPNINIKRSAMTSIGDLGMNDPILIEHLMNGLRNIFVKSETIMTILKLGIISDKLIIPLFEACQVGEDVDINRYSNMMINIFDDPRNKNPDFIPKIKEGLNHPNYAARYCAREVDLHFGNK